MIAVIGEAMLEISDVQFPGRCNLRFGGDTLNTAIYLARAGIPCRYVTALGRDRFSEDLLAAWQEEGIDTAWVLRHPHRIPGLYAIRTRADGEREFDYWRGESAAAAMLEAEGADAVLEALSQVEFLYLTGITLSVLGRTGRARLLAVARSIRRAGRSVVFDPNYRRQQWPDAAAAREAIDAIAACSNLVLAGMDDERAVHGTASAADCFRLYSSLGVAEVVIKDGANGAAVSHRGTILERKPAGSVSAFDTTGAGDAYNAAYIAARLRGGSPHHAAAAAQELAEMVIRHPGAIAPRSATDAVMQSWPLGSLNHPGLVGD